MSKSLGKHRSRVGAGHLAEDRAASELRNRGYQIVERNLKTFYAEVDLLVRSPAGRLILIEVKASAWPDGLTLGLSAKQRARLERARHWLSDQLAEPIEGFVMIWGGRSWVFHCFSELDDIN